MSGKGTKRSRPEDSFNFEGASTSQDSQPGAKRARTDEGSTGFFGTLYSKVGSAFGWISDRFRTQRGPASTENMAQQDDPQPIDMRRPKKVVVDLTKDQEDEVQILTKDQEDEVQIVCEKPAPKPIQSPIRFGSMSYGPLFQRQHEFRVVTQEKRHKDKSQSSPQSILSRVKNANLTATKKPPSANSFWLQHTSSSPGYYRKKFPLQKSIVRNRTPKIDYLQAFNREDHLKYSAILFGSSKNVDVNPNAFPKPTALKHRPRSLFAKEVKAPASKPKPPVLEKDQKRPKTPPKSQEVITLDQFDDLEPSTSYKSSHSKAKTPVTPSSSFKPKSLGPDDDVIEILNTYSPPEDQKQDVGGKDKRCEFKEELNLNPYVKEDYLSQLRKKYDHRLEENQRLIKEERIRSQHCQERIRKLDKNIEERLRDHLKVTDVAIPDPPPPESSDEEEEEEVLPEITTQMEEVIENALSSGGETLVDAYKIAVTRKDIDTLRGLNWLNDEVINFYLQMVVERSSKHDNWPKVYAMNTFFYPKLMQSGHAALKRWTRKVDIFAHDLIVIPVHLGMHWCLATIDLKKKGVYYYDSMGGNNTQCLAALLKYLEDEHLDKKKSSFDTSDFEAQIVKDIPQQMNGFGLWDVHM